MLDLDCNTVNISQDEPMPEIPIFQYTEWTWSMRRQMQEIIPGVFLGPYSAAFRNNITTLRDHGVSHIICVRQEIERRHIKPQINDFKINYLTLDIADSVTENIIPFFPIVRKFVDEALQHNGKVLIHGSNGISRSATLVLAYVMEKYGLSSKEAIEYVKRRRGCIHPNEGFQAQLREYEPIYKARQTLERGGTSNECRKYKRKCEQLSENGNTNEYELIQPPPSPISDNNNFDNKPCNDISNDLYKLWMMKS